MLSSHSYTMSLFHWVVLFLPLHTVWRSHTLPSIKYLGHLTDVCFVRWTLSGHKGKHRMTETRKGEAEAGDNPFPVDGNRREINGWEFSSTTGFQQNISLSTERPDSLKWKCFTKKHLFLWPFSRIQARFHQNPPVTLLTQLESLPHLPCESSKSGTAWLLDSSAS